MDVIGLWEEAGVTRENMETSQWKVPDWKPRTFLLWFNSAKRCITITLDCEAALAKYSSLILFIIFHS